MYIFSISEMTTGLLMSPGVVVNIAKYLGPRYIVILCKSMNIPLFACHNNVWKLKLFNQNTHVPGLEFDWRVSAIEHETFSMMINSQQLVLSSRKKVEGIAKYIQKIHIFEVCSFANRQ